MKTIYLYFRVLLVTEQSFRSSPIRSNNNGRIYRKLSEDMMQTNKQTVNWRALITPKWHIYENTPMAYTVSMFIYLHVGRDIGKH